MANVYGYKSKLIALPETTYGTVSSAWTSGFAHNDTTIDIADSTELVERMVRSGVLGETTCETVDGRVGGQVTISGAFSPKKHWMIGASALKSTQVGNIVFDTQDDGRYSFTLVRDYGNGKVDVAYGCVATSFELSNDDNFINYSITFDAQEVEFGQTKTAVFASMTGEEPKVECETPFRTKDFHLELDTDINPLSFTLSITNELDEDKVNFGIGNKKSRAVVSKTTGEFTVEGLLVSEAQELEEIGTEIKNTIGFVDDVSTVTIQFTGKVSSRSIPDVERGAYILSYTMRVVNVDGSKWMTAKLA